MNRRTFLKLTGAGSVAFAAGCSPESPKYLYSLVHAPDDMVTGKATWYAGTCRECPAGCGVLARNREGRVVKLEGNPLHPINRGKLCMRGQAALQAVYHPERLKTPLLKDGAGFRPIAFDQALALLKSRTQAAARKGPDRVRLLTEVVGESMTALFRDALAGWNSGGPTVFEPFAYEGLKTANRDVFGVDGLVSYRLEQADFLLSFGAEFLETWLSPVEYAWKFKTMHALRGGAKGVFFHAGPYQGLTGANADVWLACAPGSEAVLALGLVRRLLEARRGAHLPADLHALLETATAPYNRETVLERCGLSPEEVERLVLQLAAARRPLVLGAGCAASDDNGLKTHIAANLLNLMLDPELTLIDAAARHRVETADRRAEVLALFDAMAAGQVAVAILNNVNPVFALPPAGGVREALSGEAPFVVSLGAFLDETAALADLVLPVRLPLETWDEYGGWASLSSTLQPAMGRLTEAPHLTDVFLEAGFEARRPAADAKSYLAARLLAQGRVRDEAAWVDLLRQGGLFKEAPRSPSTPARPHPGRLAQALTPPAPAPAAGALAFAAAPSVRLFDGRGANRPWLSEIPEPLSRVAWQSPVLLHPDTARAAALKQGDIVRLETGNGALEAPVCPTETVRPGTLVMPMGQGHTAYGRYAAGVGANPVAILPVQLDPLCGGRAAGRSMSACGTPVGR